MKAPDPQSKRSARRKTRGFVSLEVSCRKHRRAKRRSLWVRNQYGKIGKPGELMYGASGSFAHRCGGSIKYHAT